MTTTEHHPGKEATIYDVAEYAGVSHMTVSRVLNDQPHVSQRAREAVLAAIEALGYHPNADARRLAQNSSRTSSSPVTASGTQHVLRHGNYSATVASVGASLRTLMIRDRDLILPFSSEEARPAFRGAILAPWPNRVVNGRYHFRGVDYQLPLTEPNRGHALHGLAAWLDFDVVDKKPDKITLTAAIQPQTGYPWRLRVETTYKLDGYGLSQSVTATNESSTPAPWGTAPHPYLVAGKGPIDDWILALPATEVLHVTPEMIPTQLRRVDADDPDRFDYRHPRVIGATHLDHAFTGLSRDHSGTASLHLVSTDRTGVTMSWDTSCPWVQIYTSDMPDPADRSHRAGLAVEPMTCAPDAMNGPDYPFDTGLVTLEPGAHTTAGWRIAAA